MDHPEHLLGADIELPILLQLGLVRSTAASRVAWHSHRGYEMLFLLEGATGYEFKAGPTVELQGGHFLIVPPKTLHRGKHDVRAPCRVCGLALHPLHSDVWRHTTLAPADVSRLESSLNSSGLQTHPFSPTLRWLVKRLMEEGDAYWQNRGDGTNAAMLRTLICGAILEAVRQIVSPPQAPKAIVAAAVQYLEKHHQEPLSIERLAKHLGYSRSRVFEMFKSETGLTPNDYLRRVRIEKARQLLESTSRSVTEIAFETGFSSGQYFCTVFRHYTGATPQTYRAAARQP